MMDAKQYLLIKLAEEAQEVAQRALKAAQFGLDEIEDGKSLSNRQRLNDELNDFQAIVMMMSSEDIFTFISDMMHLNDKREAVLLSMEYSHELGCVSEVLK